MRLCIAVLVCSFLFGCVVHQKLRGPGGNIGYSMSCPGPLGVARCYDKAHKLCPNGFTELNTQAENTLSIECK